MVEDVRHIRRQLLPNGLTVITEEMQHIRSISVGIWVRSGSRDEAPEWNGISHFIEHMVFKGTKHRSAEDIARQVDSIGGNMDAFTAKECICFNVKVLDEHLPIAMEVLSDLVLNPVFDNKDIGRERGVILENWTLDSICAVCERQPDPIWFAEFVNRPFVLPPRGRPPKYSFLRSVREIQLSQLWSQEKLFYQIHTSAFCWFAPRSSVAQSINQADCP